MSSLGTFRGAAWWVLLSSDATTGCLSPAVCSVGAKLTVCNRCESDNSLVLQVSARNRARGFPRMPSFALLTDLNILHSDKGSLHLRVSKNYTPAQQPTHQLSICSMKMSLCCLLVRPSGSSICPLSTGFTCHLSTLYAFAYFIIHHLGERV